MVKNKRFISAIVVASVCIAVSGAYAAGRIYTNKTIDDLKNYVDSSNKSIQVVDSEQQVLESRYNEVLKQYNESRKQTVLIQNQIDRLNFDRNQYQKKKEQHQLVEKYQLQVEYYNVCLFIKQLSLAQNELEVVNKQISVEREKLNQGDSTQLAVDELNSRKRIIQDKISGLNQNIEVGKNALKSRLNETSGIQFDPSFTIPSVVEGTDTYSLSELQKKCKDNNIDLLQMNAYLGFYNTLISNLKAIVGENDSAYFSAISERVKLQADANIMRTEIDNYVEHQYSIFKQSLSAYTTAQERKDILNRQLDLLKTKYENGDISELQYLSDRYLILKELYDGYSAIIGKINEKTLMSLIEAGIVMGK
ncbi:MAG TPA: TolC family protein [Pseudobacteroides sp.]|nr:TolC family protein [Pseudobacteroides sp.]